MTQTKLTFIVFGLRKLPKKIYFEANSKYIYYLQQHGNKIKQNPCYTN